MVAINGIPQQAALILSILTIFVAGTESQANEKIQEPSSFIFVSVILKCIKAVLVILVFSCNGNMNDYFVSFFFVATSLCGLVYVRGCGYRLPEELKPEEERNDVLRLRNKILSDLVFGLQERAFIKIAAISFGCFAVGLTAVYEAEAIFGAGQEVSTMGISASIMIMINVVSWPHIMEGIRK